jgi:chloramphenicol 3-O-phosphotransferase
VNQLLLGHHMITAVTGIQAAGKSTVARLLAERFTHGVHIEADALQRMIVSGAAWVEAPGPPHGEAEGQLRLRLKHMCLLARSFVDAGFTVVLDDIILGDRYHQLVADLQGYPFALAVLAPRLDIVQRRDRARSKRTLGDAWAAYLDAELHATMRDTGIWIDNSNQTPDETVNEIIRRLRPTLE